MDFLSSELTHSLTCYEPTLRVPLLVRAPDGRRAGERSKAVVSVVDVFPTLIAALDLGSSGDVDGVDLMGPGPEDRPGVYFESYSGLLNHGWSPLAGWADAQGKYVHSAAPELFDPIADPGETTDLLTADGARTESYRRRLAELSRLPTLAIEGIDTDTEALMAELERLGYAASGSEAGPLPDPLDECDRPSPHARMAEAYAMGQAAALGDAGELEEGADALRLILDGNPHNLWARRYLGTYLLALDRPGEAEPHFRALLEAGAERAATVNSLGVCLEKRGEDAAALLHYRRAASLDPRHRPAVENVQALLERLGRKEEARTWRARLEALGH